MYEELTLLKKVGKKVDKNGFSIDVFDESEILGEKKSIRGKEFYEAQSNGFKIDIMFIIKPYEYDGEKYLNYENTKYKIERTYIKNQEQLELICSMVS